MYFNRGRSNKSKIKNCIGAPIFIKKQTTKEYWKATNHRILLILLGHTTIISRAPKKGKLSKMGV